MKAVRIRWAKTLALIMVVGVCGLVFVVSMNGQDASPIGERPSMELSAAQMAQRGAYLVQVGNCAACHTARGGLPFAGGESIDTPFGSVVTSNITSDKLTGIGGWTAADFWQAMHHGR